MYHRIGIKPYKNYSEGYKKLRKLLGLARYNPRDTYGVLFNWGSSQVSNNSNIELNNPRGINNSRNKVTTMRLLQSAGIRVPRFTTDMNEARLFHFPVYCRRNYLSGGLGITMAHNVNELIRADFYTESIPFDSEYRVHVYKDTVLCWAKKIPKDNSSNQYIRNHSKGYQFSLRDNDRIFSKLKEYAIQSIKLVGLDYGCVDVILSKDRHFFVLETNSAVGLEGTTLESYASKFRNERVV